MNKTGSNPFLIIYIIICVVCFLLTVLLFSLTLLDYESKILEIMAFLWTISPYSSIELFSLLYLLDAPSIWQQIIFWLIVLILWAVSVISVLLSTKSSKPWHIPAIVLLSIDTFFKYFMLVTIGLGDWQFSIFIISTLLLDGLLFFLIWKIRKYSTADEPEQIPQKYIDNGLRDI